MSNGTTLYADVVQLAAVTLKCSSCKQEKECSFFYRNAHKKSGFASSCKGCANKAVQDWRKKNPEKARSYAKKLRAADPEKFRGYNKKWSDANKAKVAAKSKRWAAANRGKILKATSDWEKRNPEKHQAIKLKTYKKYYANKKPEFIARNALREQRKRKATPFWANLFFVSEAYDLAARRTVLTGFEWHVDHVVPLKSKLVCGLHAHTNLQVIPAVENFKKGNKLWVDMP